MNDYDNKAHKPLQDEYFWCDLGGLCVLAYNNIRFLPLGLLSKLWHNTRNSTGIGHSRLRYG